MAYFPLSENHGDKPEKNQKVKKGSKTVQIAKTPYNEINVIQNFSIVWLPS